MVPPSPRPLILDSGALIALERQDPFVATLIEDARRQGRRLIVATTVLAEVWRGGQGPPTPIARLLKREQSGDVVLEALDSSAAKAVGLLSAAVGHYDLADVHVAYLSRRHDRAPIITADPEDLTRFGRDLTLVRV